MMIPWWIMLYLHADLVIWVDPIPQMLNRVGRDYNQAATFVPIPYHCWHAYLIRTRATAVSFPYAFVPLCFHPCISRPKDHLHASHPQPLLTFLALKLNDIMRWWFVYRICNLKESKTCVIICNYIVLDVTVTYLFINISTRSLLNWPIFHDHFICCSVTSFSSEFGKCVWLRWKCSKVELDCQWPKWDQKARWIWASN